MSWAAEAAGRERWGHTVRVVQWLHRAFTGQSPDATDIAPEWVFPKVKEEAHATIPQEMQVAAWDAWCVAFKAAVKG